ncbi:hypothetical protein [Fulvivirga lutea]|uniref:Big-1 domain-containing protein n=1 Tax=Fulvivirga lutea TaxID=2810512 RepID=A0A975A0V0_9BACT|nr:hypothetical protein [Fulvivirga lutea]QSE97181.1 hypothetical protein JR347_16555 [Fulvivirga lutea]
MRLVLVTTLFFAINILYAQAPNSFNYQAVVRDEAGNILSNKQVNFNISIIEGSETGSTVYSENHLVTTNANGLVSLQIGAGTVLVGDFSAINWGESTHYAKVELDINGGTNFELLGINKLNSVPYALFANKVDPSSLPWKINAGNLYYNDGYIGVGTDNPGHHLEINVDATGDEGINRQFISVRNVNNTFKSYAAVGLASGTGANKSDGSIAVTAMNYSALPDLAGMTYVVNNENGVAVRARNANGKIKFWTGGDGSSFERMTINSLGNVGINNTSPNYTLDINGTLNTTELLVNGNPIAPNSPWSKNSDNIFFNEGLVGIGTNNPGHHLEINVDATGDDGINRQFISVRNVNNTFKSYAAVGLASGTGANKSDGSIAVTAMNYSALPDLAGMTYVVNNENGVAIRARNANGKIKFWTGGDGSSFERMTINSLGNVGINNTSPNYTLDINGTLNTTELLVNGNPIAPNSPWSKNSDNIFFNEGLVGIGTNNPGHHLEINVDATGDDGINRQFISVRNVNNTFKSYAAVGLASGTGANKSDGSIAVTAMNYSALPDLAGMTYVVNNENGVAIRARNANGKIKFWTGGDGSSFERMTINSSGNVGINNPDPKSKLQVSNGDVYIDEIGSGVIMKSSDGNCWRMTVDNSGNPVFASITCPN